jgi:hypothetical protein
MMRCYNVMELRSLEYTRVFAFSIDPRLLLLFMPISPVQSSQRESYKATTLTLQSGMQHACANLVFRTESNSTCVNNSPSLVSRDQMITRRCHSSPNAICDVSVERHARPQRFDLSTRSVITASGSNAFIRAIWERRVRFEVEIRAPFISSAEKKRGAATRHAMTRNPRRSSLPTLINPSAPRHETAHHAAASAHTQISVRHDQSTLASCAYQILIIRFCKRSHKTR